jgi:small-conductance mechanosensitive channel
MNLRTQDASEPERTPEVFVLGDLIELPQSLAFLEFEAFGSSLLNWGVAVLVLLLAHPALKLALSLVAGRLEALSRRVPGRADELVGILLRRTKGIVVFIVAAWIAALTLSPDWAARMGLLARLAILLQVGFWAAHAVNWFIARYRSRQIEEDPGAATAMGAIAFLVRLGVWSVVVLSALSVMDFEIGPALAGLGVGGIAVALAVQNILGDLFASLSIVFDRPFVIGDFIIVGDHMGTVEHVGLKTTRVRSLSGEQLVFSNSDLLNSRVRNFKRMDERRILFGFGVQYDTGYEKLNRIPGIVREIIEDTENTRFDRAHFAEFGDSSLDFEVVYFMTVPDFNSYRDAQQTINLELYRRLGEMGVDFAFPTRTLHLHLDGAEAPVRARILSPAEANGDHPEEESDGGSGAAVAEADTNQPRSSSSSSSSGSDS